MLKLELTRILRSARFRACSVLVVSLLLAANTHAEDITPDRLYGMVLDSISCDGGSDIRVRLAEELKKSAVSLSDARRDSMGPVNRWCRLQLRKNSTDRELASCRTQYQADLDRYLAKAIVPNAYPNESARFTWRKSVAPVCNLTKSERQTIANLGTASTTEASTRAGGNPGAGNKSSSRKPATSAAGNAPPADDLTTNTPGGASQTDVRRTTGDGTANTPPSTSAARGHGTGGARKTKTSRGNASDETPLDVPASSDTETEASDNILVKSMRSAGHGLQRVIPNFLIPAGDKGSSCPHSKDFARMLANHELHPDTHTLDDASHTPLENQACTSANAGYNQTLLDAIFDVHQDLKRLQIANPRSSVAKSSGGGYGYLHNAGLNTGYMIGDETGARANPNLVSFCSGAYVTVFMKAMNSIAGGAIFKSMTAGQRKNFKQLGDGHGVYGILNGDEGAWELAKYAPQGYPIVQKIGGYQDRGALKKACAGDMMAWDRTINKHGHAGYFLGSVGGKAYFWSSNKSTNGYGVTCEKESEMLPKIVRLTHPENLAALPEYAGQKHLAGTARPDTVKRLLASLQNSTPAPARTDALAQLTTTPPDPTGNATRAD